jgi:hypothetical protein
MEFAELDRELTGLLNLEQGCVFALKPKKSDNQLEFIYPNEIEGLTVPFIYQGIIWDKVIMNKSPLILNDFQGETDIIYLNSLTMEGTEYSIAKMIAYPVCLARQICIVVLVVRKNQASLDSQNFVGEDLKKIKSAVDKMIYLRLVNSA